MARGKQAIPEGRSWLERFGKLSLVTLILLILRASIPKSRVLAVRDSMRLGAIAILA